MKKLCFIMLAVFSISAFARSVTSNDSTIIISEIMFAGPSGNNEFIELYNTSTTDTVDLNNFRIKYYSSSADEITDAGAGTMLGPRSFAVIFEGDYDAGSGIYKDVVRPGALVLKISDNAFGSSGMSNSSDRIVRLYDSSGTLLEEHTYSADNAKGISDEKILLNNDTTDSNWGNSLLDLGTPGFRNSISPVVYDPGIDEFYPAADFQITGNSIALFAKIKNFGINDPGSVSLNIFLDINNDSTGQPGELIKTFTRPSLAPDDSVIFQINAMVPNEGENLFIAYLQSGADENLINNKAYLSVKGVKINEVRNDLVINEIMYAPDSPLPEWVEIFNRSDKAIDISNYSIADNSDTVLVYNHSLIINPNKYFIFSSDSTITNYFNLSSGFSAISLPTLNNSGDKIILLDSLYRVIDSLQYSPGWGGNNGYSLERISAGGSSTDPGNWQSSKDYLKATPGKINSVTKKKYDVSVTKFLFSPTSPLIGENVGISALLKNIGENPIDFSVSLFEDTDSDSIEDKILNKLNGQHLDAGDSLELNFVYSIYSINQPHNIIVKAESAIDQDTSNNKIYENITPGYPPGSMVINEIMYDPAKDEPEWIELFNNYDKDINIKNWQLINLIPSARDYSLSTANHFIGPGDYLIIASDSSFFKIHPAFSSDIIFLNFGSLNNNFDGIAIRDLKNRLIDSLVYSSDWGGGDGTSLERVSPVKDSNDRNNWASSKNSNGSTPGMINSVSQKDFDVAVTGIIFDPQRPFSGDDVNITAIVKNPGKNNADFILDLFEGNSILLESTSNNNLAAGDSAAITFNYSIKQIDKQHAFIVRARMQTDQDTTNNSIYKDISPGYRRNSVVINEIMYDPADGEPEWIELFNNSNEIINLNDWEIINLLPSPSSAVLTMDNIQLNPSGYMVIARDSSFSVFHPDTSIQLIISDFGSLNNSADGLSLADKNGGKIDSLIYYSAWGDGNGTSLERVSPVKDSNDRNNWASAKNNNRSTPGMINSISQKDFDVAVTGIIFDPQRPYSGDDVNITAIVKNPGKNNADFILDLFEGNSVLLDSISGNNLAAGDSVAITFNYSIKQIDKQHAFTVRAKMQMDQDTTNNSIYKNISPGYRRNSVVINEIMYDPADNEPEWIELFNTSDEKINLKDWEIINLLPSPSSVKLTPNDYQLNSSGYLVIARDSSFSVFHPGKNIQLIIFDFGSLNNSADGISLADKNGNMIDSLIYYSTWGGGNGTSIERISSATGSDIPLNWKSSRDNLGSTPGKINSVSRKDFDIAISQIIFSPQSPLSGDNVKISVLVNNPGKNKADFSLKLFEGINKDSISDSFLDSVLYKDLSPLDSVIVPFNYLVRNISEEHNFIVKSIMNSDQDTTNNSIYKDISPGYRRNSVVINEIMYDPADGEPEWIELFNTSDKKIDLNDWKIINLLPSPSSAVLTMDNIQLNPSGYMVIAQDSSFLEFHPDTSTQLIISDFGSLNNSADGISLADKNRNLIDSLIYYSTWGGGNGTSIERISSATGSDTPLNWKSSKDNLGSTPGKVNSISRKDFDIAVSRIIFGPQSPLSGDNVKISVLVNNPGKNKADFSLKLFEDINKDSISDSFLDSVLYKDLSPLDSVIIPFNYLVRNISGEHNFIVKAIMNLDQDSTNNIYHANVSPGYRPGSILINEVMYDPAEDEPEWIELYNNSNRKLNLKGWSVCNLLPSPSCYNITDHDYMLDPGAFLVLAGDSAFYNAHPAARSGVIISEFGSLNNTSDGILIADNKGTTVDSLIYNSDWGGGNGFSLERIQYAGDSNDSTNWRTSISPGKSTPGFENSAPGIKSFTKYSFVINEILFDPSPGKCEFIEFYNTTDSALNIGGWHIINGSGKIFPVSDTSRLVEPGGFFVLAADSTIIKSYYIDPLKLNIASESSFGLPNSSGLILLKDANGDSIDSLQYSDSWHNPNFTITQGKSLEKINPYLSGNDQNNWSTSASANGATPGKRNSIFTTASGSSAAKISVSPNPFSPDNDGFEDFTIINYRLPQKTAQVRIKIFDSRGRLVRTLRNNAASGSNGSVIFNGLDENHAPLRMGIYIILIEAINSNSGVSEQIKTVVVVARKL